MEVSKREPYRTLLWLALGLVIVLAVSFWVAGKTEANLFGPGVYDSYTKQALAWRQGNVSLGQDYPWLELVILDGEYYVSFPPTPSVPMFFLSFIFGENIPSGFVTLLYMIGGFIALFYLARRYFRPGQAMACAVFAVLGNSLLDLAVSGQGFSGGVWYQAQVLGFLFTSLAFLLVDGQKKSGWAIGLICIALAVGCRPFNALYVPILLWLLYTHVKRDTLWHSVVAMIPYVIVPALIACAYGAYNYVRFGNPLEFGHALLPEYEQAQAPVFGLRYFMGNVRNIMRPFSIQGGALLFPVVSGFAAYFTSPMVFMGGGRTLERAVRREGDIVDAILGATLVLHVVLFLMHRTFGTWQYGTRYLSDLLPAIMYLFVRGCRPLRLWESFAMGAFILLNTYGTIVFHFL